ncbi:MAG: polyprenyl synthetase family protein [Clostridium sp.]|nr:polyprenyl synthetase family protein [Clostridium sp.]
MENRNSSRHEIMDLEGLSLLEPELMRVNQHIERLFQSQNPSMQKILQWVLQARGKQLRPILTLLCAKLAGKQIDVTEIAAVIEIYHTASLLHDDVIDEAELRRGQLSVSKKFGREMAVYAGDFMIFSAISRTSLVNKPWYRELFGNLESLCDGEIGQFDNRFNTEISEEQYLQNIIGKTCSVFRIACLVGAYEGKCNKAERQAAERFAESLGIAFQLRDDLMDFIATDTDAAKTVHQDFRSGYYTLPAIYTFAHPGCGELLRRIAADIQSGVGCWEGATAEISKLIESADGYGYTMRLIRGYCEEAICALNVFQNSEAKHCLKRIAESVREGAEYLMDNRLC